jgi:alkylation response protein AidB-like acyl-CoA dehydrogenase
MDFGFSKEQEMLRASARRFLAAECPSSLVRAAMESPSAHVPALWRQIAGLGWLGVLIPEDHGGLGGSFLDMSVLLEEMGHVLLPGPYFATAILGVLALREAGSRAQQERIFPALARGDLCLTLALGDANGGTGAAGCAVAAHPRGGGYVLSGEQPFVMDAQVADTMVVAARINPSGTGGVVASAGNAEAEILVLVDAGAPGVEITPLKTVDMTRRLCTVRLRGVLVEAADVVGAPGTSRRVVRRILDHALVAIAIELVGTGQRALDLSIAYARERVQFGRPIGSFQAVKHACVDMMIAVETARSLAYYAAWAVSENAPEAGNAAAMAKAYCSDMGKTVTSQAIQVHGGIGFTWEHDLHLYHRRALASEAAFGAAPVHRETVARAIAG